MQSARHAPPVVAITVVGFLVLGGIAFGIGPAMEMLSAPVVEAMAGRPATG